MQPEEAGSKIWIPLCRSHILVYSTLTPAPLSPEALTPSSSVCDYSFFFLRCLIFCVCFHFCVCGMLERPSTRPIACGESCWGSLAVFWVCRRNSRESPEPLIQTFPFTHTAPSENVRTLSGGQGMCDLNKRLDAAPSVKLVSKNTLSFSWSASF